ncbi:D-alanyl-D-alanine carboxypeptidase [Martelella alba]|uniref:D-alanyl-D-alanine carboxypeptidase n=1 Tax=Martelella alba TaxID=2590451 RepID=A0A506U0X6_9HYPH|nr:D-alanyl-D-alanine carboxypeptidase [Martelella alba]TPW28013.1 D-alanyl-D-alanine carboxypeptidase [Martelella alba]
MLQEAFRRFRLSSVNAVLTFVFTCVVISTAFPAISAADTNDAAIVVDANTGKVLYSENPDARRFPASLTKMMTLYLMFEAIDNGQLTLNSKITFSKNASAQPPTKLGIRPGGSITVQTAIYSLITRSANDVAVAVAEDMGGSVSGFANMMNNKARSLGMTNTHYENPNGLPNSRHVTTARDQAKLGLALRQHFPEYYKYFSTTSFKYGNTSIANHNHMLGTENGIRIDGIKTGYTNASGFNIATSATMGNRSIVAVVMGGSTAASRDKWADRLITSYMKKASNSRKKSYVIARASTPRTIAMDKFPDNPPIPYQRPVADSGIALAYASADEPVPAPAPAVSGLSGPQADLIANVPIPTERAPAKSDEPLTVEDVLASANHAVDAVGEAIVPAANAAQPAPDKTLTTQSIGVQGWVVQVGTAATVEGANAILERTKTQADGTLKSTKAYTLAYNSGGQQLYRARFAGFSDEQEAVNACLVLKRNGVECWASLQ